MFAGRGEYVLELPCSQRARDNLKPTGVSAAPPTREGSGSEFQHRHLKSIS